MGEYRVYHRRAGPSASLVIAFILVAFGVLKLIESIKDRRHDGWGSVIIGAALLLPSAVRLARGERPHFWLSLAGLLVLAAGIFNLVARDVPWSAIILIAAGLWFLLRTQFQDRGHAEERRPEQ